MGLVLNLDLETSQGPTNELFISIDSWKVNCTVGEIKFSTTAWLDKSYADKFRRKYCGDELKPAIGLVAPKVVYYNSPTSDGIDIVISNYYSLTMSQEKVVEVDIIEEREITKEVPYISFDEEGNEITLYKSVTTTEEVKIGTKEETKEMYNYNIPLDNLGNFCYTFLRGELGKTFPIGKIKKI